MALALDGTPVTGSGSNAISSVTSAAFTTANGSGVVIAIVGCTQTTAAPTITGFTAGSLSFTQRFHVAQNMSAASAFTNYDTWWAPYTVNVSAQTIKANFSGNADSAAIVVFAVSGANTSSPFDANVSLPGSIVSNTGSGGNVQFTGISTNTANTFVFSSFYGCGNDVAILGTIYGAGYTTIGHATNQNNTFACLDSEYDIMSSTLSNATVAWNNSGSLPADFNAFVDAIVGGGGASVTPFPRRQIIRVSRGFR